MLISFQVGNYRSFAGAVTFSLEATKAYEENSGNVAELKNGLRLLRVAAIYGANASGKTNLYSALFCMRKIVLGSSKRNSTDKLRVDPFRLNKAYLQKPTHFEVTFTIDQYIYRYGFEATKEQVTSEWLFRSLGGRHKEFPLFTLERTGQDVLLEAEKELIADGASVNREAEVSFDAKKIVPNSLFLAKLDQENNTIAKGIMAWFDRLGLISSGTQPRWEDFTVQQLEQPAMRNRIINFVQVADAAIVDVTAEKRPINLQDAPDAVKEAILHNHIEETVVRMVKKGVDGESVVFSLHADESAGTTKMFCLSGPVLNTLDLGDVLFVDELESRLHPVLTRRLVELFNTSETNPYNAQLIFITHETNLLTGAGLRRDQIWFCEKSPEGASDLYSLADIRDVRKGANIEKNYFQGKYGAIPFYGDVAALFPRPVAKEPNV